MDIQENEHMGPWLNAPGTTRPWYSVTDPEKCPYFRQGMSPEMSGALMYRCVYPDIYYIIQPHIMRACDEMDAYETMPDEEMIERKCNQIHDDVCRMHPELAEYAREYQMKADDPPNDPDGFSFRDEFERMHRFRPRRGVFGDLLRILLLSELFDRRRRIRRFY